MESRKRHNVNRWSAAAAPATDTSFHPISIDFRNYAPSKSAYRAFAQFLAEPHATAARARYERCLKHLEQDVRLAARRRVIDLHA